MNLETTVFACFIVLALTLNFVFFYCLIDHALHHNPYVFFAALVLNLVVMMLKFSYRTHVGTTMLATSLVANLQLIAASIIWGVGEYVNGIGTSPATIGIVVSLAGGALVANVISVVLLVIETISVRR